MATEKRHIDKDNLFNVSSVVVDIEGTTTSISFVKDTLFPYAREHLEEYINSKWSEKELQNDVALLREQAATDKSDNVEGVIEIPEGEGDDVKTSVIKNVLWQMDNDRKTKALKQLQGQIWRDGYTSGKIVGHVYDDVKDCLKLWTECGKHVYIYSSGSVEAQKLLFGNSKDGDLLSMFSGYFDTEVGPKTESSSYVKIFEKIKENSHVTGDAKDILFLTDVPKEAQAAADAGMKVAIVIREGNSPLPDNIKESYPTVTSFSDITFEGNLKRRKLSHESENTVKNNENEKVEGVVDKDTEMEVCSNDNVLPDSVNDDKSEETNKPVESAATEKGEGVEATSTTKSSEEQKISSENVSSSGDSKEANCLLINDVAKDDKIIKTDDTNKDSEVANDTKGSSDQKVNNEKEDNTSEDKIIVLNGEKSKDNSVNVPDSSVSGNESEDVEMKEEKEVDKKAESVVEGNKGLVKIIDDNEAEQKMDACVNSSKDEHKAVPTSIEKSDKVNEVNENDGKVNGEVEKENGVEISEEKSNQPIQPSIEEPKKESTICETKENSEGDRSEKSIVDDIMEEDHNIQKETIDKLKKESDEPLEQNEAVCKVNKETDNESKEVDSKQKEAACETKEDINRSKEVVNDTKNDVNETTKPVSDKKEGDVNEPKEPISKTNESVASETQENNKTKEESVVEKKEDVTSEIKDEPEIKRVDESANVKDSKEALGGDDKNGNEEKANNDVDLAKSSSMGVEDDSNKSDVNNEKEATSNDNKESTELIEDNKSVEKKPDDIVTNKTENDKADNGEDIKENISSVVNNGNNSVPNKETDDDKKTDLNNSKPNGTHENFKNGVTNEDDDDASNEKNMKEKVLEKVKENSSEQNGVEIEATGDV